jgi:hypothetical protein
MIVQIHARGTLPVGREKGAGGPKNHQMPSADLAFGLSGRPLRAESRKMIPLLQTPAAVGTAHAVFGGARSRTKMRPTRDRRRLRDEEALTAPPVIAPPRGPNRERGDGTIPQRPHAGVQHPMPPMQRLYVKGPIDQRCSREEWANR